MKLCPVNESDPSQGLVYGGLRFESNSVDERTAIAIAAVAGVLAVFSDAQPTGQSIIDAVLIVLSVGAVVWASASAPWWASAGIAGVGAAIAFDPVVAAIGAVAYVGGLVVGIRRQDLSEIRSVIGAIAMNVLIRSELEGFLGLSAIIGIGCGLSLFVVGVRRRPPAVRRIGWMVLGGAGTFVAAALLLLAVAGLGARPDVTEAARSARQAVDVLNQGDYDGAAALFEDSSVRFRSADKQLSGVLVIPAQLVPGVAQNVSAGADLSAAAADATAEAAASLRQVDSAALRVSGGAINLDAIRAVEAPLERVQGALNDLRNAVEQIDSPWVAGPIQDELDEQQADFDDNEERLDNAIDAVRLAPALLGGDGVRRYMIIFTSPAEARGLGGFFGNYADVTVDDGRIDVTEFARRSELQEANLENRAFCSTCDEELLARYGSFGFNTGPNGSFGASGWQNLTMPAHFPYIAEATQDLYPQNGGNPIDGVIVMDPYVIQALMKYTGPIDIAEFGVTVAPDNAAQFILEDQYLLAAEDDGSGNIDNVERVDALGTLGDEVISSLLTGSLPKPPELAKDLGPLVDERRLLVWTDNEDEQDLLDRVGLLGAIPTLDDNDGGFSVSVTNASGNKIDVFLDRDVTVDVRTEPDGRRTLVADVTFTNNAPASGLPRYVIGNQNNQPEGSSQLWVTFYGPRALEVIQLNGQDTAVSTLPEAGWMGYAQTLYLGSGESATYHLEFELQRVPVPADVDGGVDALPPSTPTIWEQPLAQRDN